MNLNTTYDDVIQAFLKKISEFSWCKLEDIEIDETVLGYMFSACAKFRTSKIDLTDRDNVLKQFNNHLDDEYVDIITTGMIAEWLSPYVYNSDNMKLFLNTKDYNIVNQPQMLSQIRETQKECKLEFKSMVRNFSFNHNNINEVTFL